MRVAPTARGRLKVGIQTMNGPRIPSAARASGPGARHSWSVRGLPGEQHVCGGTPSASALNRENNAELPTM